MIKPDKKVKVQEGEDTFIKEICSATWEPLYRFIYYKVQNKEEAEDITQETYVKAISYIRKNNISIERHLGFLKTVALNVLRDRWRKNKRHGISVNLDMINPEEASENDLSEVVAQRDILLNALKLLNEEQRKIIELRIIKGYSVADTARVMDKNESNIRVIQHRALKSLTKILKDGGNNNE